MALICADVKRFKVSFSLQYHHHLMNNFLSYSLKVFKHLFFFLILLF